MSEMKKKKNIRISAFTGNPLLYVLLLAAIVALFTLYRSITQIGFEDNEQINDDTKTPTAIIFNPAIDIFDTSGDLAYTIHAETIQQYNKPQKTLIQKPEISLLRKTGAVEWSITGKTVHLFSNEEVRLEGDVQIHNVLHDPSIDIRTQGVVYNTGTEIIELPENTDIRYGNTRIQSGSASINRNTGVLLFDKKVTMTLHSNDK